jgi:hypothetical protein
MYPLDPPFATTLSVKVGIKVDTMGTSLLLALVYTIRLSTIHRHAFHPLRIAIGLWQPQLSIQLLTCRIHLLRIVVGL